MCGLVEVLLDFREDQVLLALEMVVLAYPQRDDLAQQVPLSSGNNPMSLDLSIDHLKDVFESLE